MAAVLAPSKVRSAVVFGIALTELFVLLLLVVVFLWAATAQHNKLEENVVEAALKRKLDDLQLRFDRTSDALKDAESRLKKRDEQLRMLWRLYEKTPLTISPGSAEWEKTIDDWYARARRGVEEGGRGHANCLQHGAVMQVTIYDDGIEAQPRWTPEQDSLISQVPALRQMTARGRMSVAQFDQLGSEVLAWSDGRKPRCRFDVLFKDASTQKAPYASALRAIDRTFYKSEIRG
jgi:hypothetical protein